MATVRTSIHGYWSSRFAFVLAAAGSAVGLGNIWKFPYMAGENGGGAFVLLYLICIALFGLPVMMSEVLLGRRGRSSPVNTMTTLAAEEKRSRVWRLLGLMGVLAGFLILSYYSVIAGWALAYVLETATGTFSGVSGEQAGEVFDNLISNPRRLLFWHSVFILLTMVVVIRGVNKGLETAVRILMPALFILIIIMIGYAMLHGDFLESLKFLFAPDFSKLSPEVVLKAMGQAFFSLSLGMGAIMMYGSYLPDDASIATTSFQVAIADTLIAILAGLAIFPIVLANGLEAGQGPGLIFNTLPLAFGQMTGGLIFGTLFFILLVFAAWTSAISLIEPAVAWLVEKFSISRFISSIICGLVAWTVGLGTVYSFNSWKKIDVFDGTILEGKSFFDLLDYLTSNIMLPLGGILICIFAAWLMSEKSRRDELKIKYEVAYKLWRFLARYLTPIGVVLIFLHVLGVLEKLNIT
ncbi:MAG: sodium-dependent transporter [Gammaproteobacteria bacterium]|nr:sodium-dependent transporter [Gammaproteobacteria bacterium]NNC67847.1 sodium-dependent transporter [Gammaproteobacteria bacterium]